VHAYRQQQHNDSIMLTTTLPSFFVAARDVSFSINEAHGKHRFYFRKITDYKLSSIPIGH
jgi:hypothetical protein